MLLNRFAFKLLVILSGTMLLASIGVPALTYVAWQRVAFLNKMQGEGIDTKARIVSAYVGRKSGSSQPSSVTFDIAWTDRNGGAHAHKGASPSLDYGMQFLARTGDAMYAQYALTVKQVPLKYLASDPEQFILSADPRNSAEGMNGRLPWLVAASILALANAPFFYWLRRIHMRRLALAAANPGGAEEKLDLQAQWIFMSLLFYGILVGIHFFPDTYAFDIKAFGATPFALPVTVVIIAVGTVLYLPFLWVNWHLTRLTAQAHKEGVFGRYMLLLYLLTGGGQAHLRNSRNAVWLGGLYACALFAAWIAYTTKKGI